MLDGPFWTLRLRGWLRRGSRLVRCAAAARAARAAGAIRGGGKRRKCPRDTALAEAGLGDEIFGTNDVT